MSAGEPYYIRIRGVVQGPFSEQQLQSLVLRGDFSRIHEISTDQKNWARADEHPQLFYTVVPLPLGASSAEHPIVRSPRADSAPAPPPEANSTHQEDGSQPGPVDAAGLNRFLASDQVGNSKPVGRSSISRAPLNEAAQLPETQQWSWRAKPISEFRLNETAQLPETQHWSEPAKPISRPRLNEAAQLPGTQRGSEPAKPISGSRPNEAAQLQGMQPARVTAARRYELWLVAIAVVGLIVAVGWSWIN